ncbi:adenine phosphoribosyltransferase [Actinomycetes bacterium]|nr:adenine phosphoribosyltransferase [Actinomycetes bacterium]
MDPTVEAELRARIRMVPDWPQAGVSFQDLTGLMADPVAFGQVIDAMSLVLGADRIDDVAGIEARGFPYGAALACARGAGFVTLRKPGKLPGEVHSVDYTLEYGSATLQVHTHSMGPGRRVVLVDDVLATGGTAAAGVDLIRRTGAEVAGVVLVMEIPDLGGRAVLEALGVSVHVLFTAE